MKGFLKFLLAAALIFFGGAGILLAFFGGLGTNINAFVNGKTTSSAPAWIIGIISAIMLLGGIYMLRKRR